mmetsp:Transcript_29127/g.71955  ORF Transcript_29127/g.71955 Transcript_29127/m.71955 type:complete len:477 (-) Transcript_29127:129-1559(-)
MDPKVSLTTAEDASMDLGSMNDEGSHVAGPRCHDLPGHTSLGSFLSSMAMTPGRDLYLAAMAPSTLIHSAADPAPAPAPAPPPAPPPPGTSSGPLRHRPLQSARWQHQSASVMWLSSTVRMPSNVRASMTRSITSSALSPYSEGLAATAAKGTTGLSRANAVEKGSRTELNPITAIWRAMDFSGARSSPPTTYWKFSPPAQLTAARRTRRPAKSTISGPCVRSGSEGRPVGSPSPPGLEVSSFAVACTFVADTLPVLPVVYPVLPVVYPPAVNLLVVLKAIFPHVATARVNPNCVSSVSRSVSLAHAHCTVKRLVSPGAGSLPNAAAVTLSGQNAKPMHALDTSSDTSLTFLPCIAKLPHIPATPASTPKAAKRMAAMASPGSLPHAMTIGTAAPLAADASSFDSSSTSTLPPPSAALPRPQPPQLLQMPPPPPPPASFHTCSQPASTSPHDTSPPPPPPTPPRSGASAQPRCVLY